MNTKETQKKPTVTVVFPCRNEENSIGSCIEEVQNIFQKENIHGEIIVSDSSWDKSTSIAQSYEVRVITHNKIGYGNAYLEAIPHIQGKYVIFIDADGTYQADDITAILHELKNGSDMVIGDRFQTAIQKDVMPTLNRYIGNPVLSFVFRLLFQVPYRDIHCGIRGVRRDALLFLNLRTTGMEFASEMIVEGVRNNIRITEVPVRYRKRVGTSKLRPLRDAWRHVVYMLLVSPMRLLFVPGMVCFALGLSSTLWFLFTEKTNIFGLYFYYHPMFIGSLVMILGMQMITFSFFVQQYARTHFSASNVMPEWLTKSVSPKRAFVTGGVTAVIGSLLFLWILYSWVAAGFSNITEDRLVLFALTVSVLGVQLVFSSIILSLLTIQPRR